jgi:hypothetical protein
MESFSSFIAAVVVDRRQCIFDSSEEGRIAKDALTLARSQSGGSVA